MLAGIAIALGAAGKAQALPIGIRLSSPERATGRVVILADGPVKTRGFALDKPARWVVDIPGAVVRQTRRELSFGPGLRVRQVRIGQFQSSIVRLVFVFAGASASAIPVTWRRAPGRQVPYQGVFDLPRFAGDRAGKQLVVASRPGPPGDAEAFPREPLPPVVPSCGVTVRRVGEGWIVRIVADRPIDYRLARHGQRDRLYLDVLGGNVTVPPDSALERDGLAAHVLRVPAASGSARLILEMERPLRYEAWLADGHRAIILSLMPPQQRFMLAPDADRVTVDPGHGGDDPGTTGPGGIPEKAVTLALATRVEERLLAHGLDVQLTRTGDSDVQLRPRVAMGDEFRSGAFISLHMNHSDDPAVHGIETYYFTPQSRTLAEDVHRRLVAALGAPDRGVRRNDFVVVKYTDAPACLVEVGYLSNSHEERLLDTSAYQEKAAAAIAAGLRDFLRHHRTDIARHRHEETAEAPVVR